jgi:hypothetical protein
MGAGHGSLAQERGRAQHGKPGVAHNPGSYLKMTVKKNSPQSNSARTNEADDNLDFDTPKSEVTPSPNGEPTGSAADPFDPASLRLSQNFDAAIGVKKALVSIPVRKPAKTWFIHVHPDPAYRVETAVIELKEDREIYLVAPALWSELAREAAFVPRALFTAINRQGVIFLWPLRLPGSDGKTDEWSRTALEGADRATKGWIRLAANMALGAYDIFEASDQLTKPEWPDIPFRELLRVAFKDHYIGSLNHPVLRKLRGEV